MLISEKKIEFVLRNIANKAIRKEFNKWPPGCGGLLYQPKRPTNRLRKDYTKGQV